MTSIQWDQRYELGIEAMDDEHRRIIETMRHLAEANEQLLRGRVLVLSRELVAVTREHFIHEEAHMWRMKYPDRQRHALIHRGLLGKLDAYQRVITEQKGVLPAGYLEFLRFWLATHICGIDRKYATFGDTRAKATGSAAV